MLLTNYAYKYETPHNRPFVIRQFWTNDAVISQYGAIKIMQNIRPIKSYTYDTNVEDIKFSNIYITIVNI